MKEFELHSNLGGLNYNSQPWIILWLLRQKKRQKANVYLTKGLVIVTKRPSVLKAKLEKDREAISEA